MVAAKDTFIHSIIDFCGLVNVFSNASRYPEVSIEEIQAAAPELCFLSSEPFPFTQIHLSELQIQLPHSKIVLVDGELFSWYGSRLQKSVKYFNELIKQL